MDWTKGAHFMDWAVFTAGFRTKPLLKSSVTGLAWDFVVGCLLLYKTLDPICSTANDSQVLRAEK